MNESEFEQQLRGLRPSRPSRELEGRIARELDPVSVPRAGSVSTERRSWLERLLPALGWASVGAAAAVIAMLSLNLARGGPKEVPAPAVLVPAETNDSLPSESTDGSVTGNVLDASDEGLLQGGPGGVARRLHYSSVERRAWTDASGAETVIEVPREDVVVVPVNFQ